MNDDELDELLHAAVREYNLPSGPVPRDAMWEGIAAARAARGAARPAARHSKFAIRRVRDGHAWSLIGLAAALLLAAGISIGLRMGAGTAPQKTVAVAQKPALPPTAVPAADTLIEQLHAETRKTAQRVAALASRDPQPASPAPLPASRIPRPAPRDPQPAAQPSLAYRLVVLQHLAGSEAMITAFRSSARSGEVDAQIAAWSRELLSTTRLLEASEASADPVMSRLLEDLDLVISQIVQYTTHGTTNAEELDLIERSINKRGVITKLRSTIPGRALTTGL